ncbi:hypothetical protein C7S16_1287 [Burkholderia thailandensis]|uniref:Uncharacterized protein n=1 Tax=Burkholderia thailandensis TaxID=57975 RepID=A0AAW9CTB8_BURTH|nr:hypothetical protein [Burkholderia thailandensis]MDW9254138.1 hypothetical protein [Burkholderia thailandensis]
MLPISATASQRSMPFALSRYFPDFRDSASSRPVQPISGAQYLKRLSSG